jgi:cyclopropane-fatty-acyl-phospholipid synthase
MIARRAVIGLLERMRHGHIVLIEHDGRRHTFGPRDTDLQATVRVHDPAFWRAALGGSLGLGELYASGGWDCDDLVRLVRIGAREMPRLDRLRTPLNPIRGLYSRVPRNTRRRARRHIAAHYDLGNDLFRLFLDESMTYSCALFERPGMTLAEAQRAKLDRICRRLELSPTDHLLEIGTGWGALAVHAAGEYGCRVTTTTISAEQHAAATERVRQAGLADRVTLLTRDYRDLPGRYDKLVSVEMIEAVGWHYFDTFFATCSRLLVPDGLMFLQAITIDDRAYEAEKAARSFANELVFPGGCLPSVAVLARSVARATNMRMVGLDDITASYPPTLACWRANFHAAAERAEELGYDRRFRRMWDLYLAYSEAGFTERRIGDVHLTLAKPAYRGVRLNIRPEIASSSAAGPRDASLASASLPPGPST